MEISTAASSVAIAPPIDDDTSPIISPPLPLFTRFTYAVRTWMFKIFVTTALGLLRVVYASKFRIIAPTYTKRYPIRPTLESRVFLPKNYNSGEKLPLYIDIHGGGFALCDPATDDHFCRSFADQFGYCVVSIDYRKAPSSCFPVPVHDCAELARAVLNDKDLPVDHKKVVLGGFSAGANLCLAIAQLDDLKGKFAALIPIYPATDFTSKFRGPYRPTKDGREDILKHSSKLFNWAYVPKGIDRRNTLLSPVYASKDTLPQKMYFVGAEYDCLCSEAHVLARKLGGVEDNQDPGIAWTKNGIRWEMLADQQHGFTHVERTGEEEEERKRMCNELYQRIDSWIRKEVFQK